jgi:hypothetical protein
MSHEQEQRRTLIHQPRRARTDAFQNFQEVYIPGVRKSFGSQELMPRSINNFPKHEFETLKLYSFETKVDFQELSSGFLADYLARLDSEEPEKRDLLLQEIEERFSARSLLEEEKLRSGVTRGDLYIAHQFLVPAELNKGIIELTQRTVELTGNSRFQANDFIIDILS